MTDAPSPSSTSRALADAWREIHVAFLEIAERIPETRAYRTTSRSGWTLKHELSHLAALNAEVLQALARPLPGIEDGTEGGPEHLDTSATRRHRGQAMHLAQEMRLGPLREHLHALGEQTAQLLEGAGDALEDGEQAAARFVRARLERAREGLELLRITLG